MEEEKGISIGEIFKIIFKRVWWVVGVTVAFLIVFVLLVQFVYNPSKRTYSVSYNFTYPNMASSQYPDGTTFRYTDLISEDTLKEIVDNSEGKYSNIDVSEMVANDDISIAYEEVDSDITPIDNNSYVVIEVKSKYFKNSEQAKDFIYDIIQNPKNKINKQIEEMDYSSNLTVGYVNAVTFTDKISYLQSQRTYLLGMYDSLINSYGQYYTINGKTLNAYRIELTNTFDNEDQTEVNNELSEKRYVLQYERYLANADTRIALLERDKTYNQNEIDALVTERNKLIQEYGSTTSIEVETFNSRIRELTTAQESIEKSITEINETVAAINAGNSYKDALEEYTAKLDAFSTKLQEQTNIFKTVRTSVYADKTEITYKGNSVSPDGGLNIILAAVIGLVVGFVLVSIVICIIDLPKYRKERDEQEKLAAQSSLEKQN
jgi:hypothetical protein